MQDLQLRLDELAVRAARTVGAATQARAAAARAGGLVNTACSGDTGAADLEEDRSCAAVLAESSGADGPRCEPRGAGRGDAAGDASAIAAAQRNVEEIEIVEKGGAVGVRLGARRGRTQDAVSQPARGFRQAGIHADEGPPVRFVEALRRGVAGRLGERVELGVGRHPRRAHAELGAELVRLDEVVLEHRGGLPSGGVEERVGGDERIAVAIAADPLATCRNGDGNGAPPLREDPRDRSPGAAAGEERALMVVEAVVDLVTVIAGAAAACATS